MIILIHGDDVINSRKRINDFIKKNDWVVRVNALSDNLSIITQSIESIELFGQKKTIVIENFLGIKGDGKEKLFDLINTASSSKNLDIVLWEDEKITDAVIKKIKVKELILLELPKSYYQFLDAVFPRNRNTLNKLYVSVTKTISEEMIFYSIVKRTRTLLIVKTGMSSEFEETKKMKEWQVKKMIFQANRWSEKELLVFYGKLFDIELNLKTSGLPLSLGKHIDFLLLSL